MKWLKELLPVSLLVFALLLSSVSSVLFSPSAKAASAYDDWLTVEEGFVTVADGANVVDIDFGDLPIAALVLDGGLMESGCSTGTLTSNLTVASCTNFSAVQTAFQEIGTGTNPDEAYMEYTRQNGFDENYWFATYSPDPISIQVVSDVMSLYTTVPDQEIYSILIRENTSTTARLNFESYTLTTTSTVVHPIFTSDFITNPSYNDCQGVSCGMIRYLLGEISFNITGYEGIESGFTPPDPYTPQIGFTQFSDLTFQALWIGANNYCIATNLDGCIQPKIRYVMLDDTDAELDVKVLDLATIYQYTFPGIGDYTFEVSFAHPGVPFALFADDVVLNTVIFELEVTGVYVNGGTGLQECVPDGDVLNCGTPDPQEDCSTYGIDLGGYFQCIINNFSSWLRGSMIQLFVPTYSYFNNWVDDFGTFLDDKLGFVANSVVIVVDLFGGIVSGAATTTCMIEPSGTFFDATVEFDVCVFEDNWPTAFGLIQGLLIALTVVSLFFAGLRKYHEVVDHR